MADLDEPNLVLALTERLHYAVDAITRNAEDDLDAPIENGFDQDVCCCLCHVNLLLVSSNFFRREFAYAIGVDGKCPVKPRTFGGDQVSPFANHPLVFATDRTDVAIQIKETQRIHVPVVLAQARVPVDLVREAIPSEAKDWNADTAEMQNVRPLLPQPSRCALRIGEVGL